MKSADVTSEHSKNSATALIDKAPDSSTPISWRRFMSSVSRRAFSRAVSNEDEDKDKDED